MKPIRLKEAATWMQAKLLGEDKAIGDVANADVASASAASAEAAITGVAIDSRSLAENELFFALVGERVNGHDFMEEAKRRKAAAVVVSQTVNTELPQLQVQDTCLALGKLANAYRKQFTLPMAAITGSYGKTTVKEMLASILAVEGEVMATQGNLNTEIGVPLTLFRLAPEHRFAVIEMGARKKHDIEHLMQIAEPTVALVNNAGIAHIEVFGSETGVRDAKGELYAGLRRDGIAVMSLEDPHLAYWKSLLQGQRIVTFGKKPVADVSINTVQSNASGATFTLTHQGASVSITLHAAGEHNIHNALAAATVAIAMGVSLTAVQKGLTQFTPVTGRLQFKKGLNNTAIIDDTYNANPASMRAALAVLASQPGEKWFVMGDMLELGEYAAPWHRDIGVEAKRLGVDKMFGVGTFTQGAVAAFGTQGNYYLHKTDLITDLIKTLKQNLTQNVTVLVKGSRGMRMEDIVTGLQTSEKIGENHAC